MKTHTSSKKNSKPNFIPDEIAIKRVSESFEKSKRDQKNTKNQFVEVK